MLDLRNIMGRITAGSLWLLKLQRTLNLQRWSRRCLAERSRRRTEWIDFLDHENVFVEPPSQRSVYCFCTEPRRCSHDLLYDWFCIDLLPPLKGWDSPKGIFRLRVSSVLKYAFAWNVSGRRPVTTPDVLSSAYSRVKAAFLPGHAGRLRSRRWSIQSTRPHGSPQPNC
jgi:hypothetical protein